MEGFFGGGSAAGSRIGVYYNDFSDNGPEDVDLWGAYTSINFAKNWNFNFEGYRVKNDSEHANAYIGKLKYGKAMFAQPKSWDIWVDYINAASGTADDGATGNWRNNVDDTKSWGVGADYTFAKNAQFQVFQTFNSKVKSTDKDRDELTRAQFVFVF